MDALLDRLYATIPSTTIVLSTLVPNGLDGVQPRVDAINAQYREIVRARRLKKQRIVIADMAGSLTLNDLVDDKTHPNDWGYKKMAYVWWGAVRGAEREGFLQAPKEVKTFGGDGGDSE